MKKVNYCVRNLSTKKEDNTTSGVGFICGNSLLVACISQKTGKAYVRVFDEVVNHCHLVQGTTNEYKGFVTEVFEIDDRTVEVDYSVWYKEINE
jgi:hypothetical protein